MRFGFTFRPGNRCKRCGHTWHPHGHDRSLECPNRACRSPDVEIVSSSPFVGGCLAFLVLIAIGYFIWRQGRDALTGLLDAAPRPNPSAKSSTENAPSPPQTPKRVEELATLTGVIQTDGSTEGQWEVVLYGADGIERRERLSRTAFRWPQLKAGPKVLHVQPGTYGAHGGALLALELTAGVETEQVVHVASAKTLKGRVVNSSGAACAYAYVQVIQVPAGPPIGPVRGATVIQQAPSAGDFADADNPSLRRLDQWMPVRIIRADCVILGTFARADGTFTLSGVAEPFAHIQVVDGTAILHDAWVVSDSGELRITISGVRTDANAAVELREHVEKCTVGSLEAGLLEQFQEAPDSRAGLLEALRVAVRTEANLERRQQLNAVLEKLK